MKYIEKEMGRDSSLGGMIFNAEGRDLISFLQFFGNVDMILTYVKAEMGRSCGFLQRESQVLGLR